MGEQCEFCLTTFKSKKYLKHHQENTKQCKRYRHVMFTCRKCGFSTLGIANIDLHMETCNGTESHAVIHSDIKDPIEELKEKVSLLEAANSEYEKRLQAAQEEVRASQELAILLRLERFKTRMVSHILEHNTSLRVNDVLVETEEGLHVYNTQNGTIPIFVHENFATDDGFTVNQVINGPPTQPAVNKSSVRRRKSTTGSHKKQLRIEDPEEEATKKPTFRSIKTSLDLSDELTEEQWSVRIAEIDAEVPESFNEEEIHVLEGLFDQILNGLKQSRVYTKGLEELKQARRRLFATMSVSEYKELVSVHVREIETILREKKYTDKKISTIVSKGLSPIESRITGYGNYTNAHLDVDTIEHFSSILDRHAFSEKCYTPFNYADVAKNFYNYGLSMFPMKQSLSRYLFNRYGFNNVGYLPLQKNTDDDPYSFYVLDSVNKEKRCWKQDCRLENLSTTLTNGLKPYMISIFRKIYRDVFGDNEFRQSYSTASQITEYDCEQLVQSIILLSQPKEFSWVLRSLVRSDGVIKPTENDKFNLTGDDALQRRRFQEKEDVDLAEAIKLLFDGISSEDAVDFVRSRTT